MNAQIAQLVEQRTENPRVTGSIPVLGIFLYDKHNGRNGRVAQVVEHLTFNQVVRGSSPRCLTRDQSSLVSFFVSGLIESGNVFSRLILIKFLVPVE